METGKGNSWTLKQWGEEYILKMPLSQVLTVLKVCWLCVQSTVFSVTTSYINVSKGRITFCISHICITLCISQEISVLTRKTEICSDMQAMFTWTDLDSYASVPSVLLDSWVQANSTCFCSADPEIINQGGVDLYFLNWSWLISSQFWPQVNKWWHLLIWIFLHSHTVFCAALHSQDVCIWCYHSFLPIWCRIWVEH